MTRYILVADEMGTPGMAYGTSNTFVFGGYVIEEHVLPQAIRTWRKAKQSLCGDVAAELKWKHFFVDDSDPNIPIPLLTRDSRERRELAAQTLRSLFAQSSIRPVMAISRKDRATDFFITQSRKGKDKIDDDLMWMGPVAQFALFLSVRQARGKLWFDALGNQKQEQRRQDSWSAQLKSIREWKGVPSSAKKLRNLLAIDEHIEFFDSKENEAVQIADFVCGVIWAAGEGDESYLLRFVQEYGDNATRQGLGILHIA